MSSPMVQWGEPKPDDAKSKMKRCVLLSTEEGVGSDGRECVRRDGVDEDAGRL
jgi:hypothetical protein